MVMMFLADSGLTGNTPVFSESIVILRSFDCGSRFVDREALRPVDLHAADFSGTSLKNGDLCGANLSEVNLSTSQCVELT